MLLNHYFKKYIPSFIFGMFVLISETMLDLVQPLLISRLIDEGIVMSDFDQVKHIGLLMIGLAMLQLGFSFLRNYMSTHVSFSFSRDVRQGLYEHMLKLNMTQIEEVERGSMINRLTFDIRQLQMLVNGSMRFFIRVPLFAIGGLIMVFGLGQRFVWMYLSSIPIVAIILLINLKFGFPKMRRIQKQLDHLNKKTIEYLNGIRVVKAFNRTAYENEQFEEVNDKLTEVSIDASVFMAIFNPAISLAVNSAVVITLYLSGLWISDGLVGVGQVVAFMNYMARLIMAMSFMARVFNMYIRGRTSANRIEEIFNLPVSDESRPVELEDKAIEEGITLKNVAYRYGEGEFALEDISLSIKSGESIGIIGATGSGKSTLIHLLTGIIEPTKGSIHIGNQCLDANSVKSFRHQIGYVPQDKILFSDSVLNNICFNLEHSVDSSDENYDVDRLKEALTISSSDFVDAMEHGIHTRLGKGGVNISGGQKQRISLARALYKNPKYLILDDCTSALDAITEKAVFEGLKKKEGAISMIVIGQKIATVRQMDRVMVLHKGRIAGIGSHEGLLETCQPYQALYQAQMGGHVE